MVQEGIEDPRTIWEASQGPIAEIPQFRHSLEAMLDSFGTMGKELGYVPDIPGLNQQNVLVDPQGKLWVVDTNTLVPPDHYYRFSFNFKEELDRLIKQLQKGQVLGNPQG